ncbi:MAG: PstS family phosphate ABC transporter substrate-binding protein [Bacteroidetes bacterium]|nr:MAG: PstS family phosphate ABC transporter substrate-binding protein [Bacteroidota bacterium]
MIKQFNKSILILTVISCSVSVPGSYSQEKTSGQISISGAFALYPMVVRWADEYKKINPGVRFDISAGGAGKGISDALNGMVEIGMVSREIYPEELKKGAFPIAVTKDAVVAVVSERNPALNDILTKGLKKEAGNNIWITGRYTTWTQAFGAKTASPIHIYTRSDACGAAEMWAKFFGKKQEDLLGVGVFGDPGLAQAVKRDPLGIGYNNIGYAYDATTRKQIKGIKVVPLDLNNNGRIDSDENFYESMNEIIAAIASGKYPSPPARELYFVMKGSPENNKVLTGFIRWVLSEGQQFVNEAGYISLTKEKIESELKKLQ